MYTARHVLNPSPLVVGPQLPLPRLVEELAAHATDVACVLEGEGLVGVVTSSDVCFPAGAPRQPALDALLGRDSEAVDGRVTDLMTAAPRIIGADTALTEVLQLLYGDDLAVLPVLDEHGQLLGIVTRKSVVQALAEGATSDEPRIIKP